MPIYSLETQVTNWWTHKVCAGYVWRAINEIPCLKFSFEMFNHQILTDLVWSRSNTRKCLHISDLSTINFWMACLWCRDVLRMVRAGGENSGQCLGVFQRDRETYPYIPLLFFCVMCQSILFCLVVSSCLVLIILFTGYPVVFFAIPFFLITTTKEEVFASSSLIPHFVFLMDYI